MCMIVLYHQKMLSGSQVHFRRSDQYCYIHLVLMQVRVKGSKAFLIPVFMLFILKSLLFVLVQKDGYYSSVPVGQP